jgi:hypothetical protein
MSRSSKIEALRRLAERPGTEAEGLVAKAMLEKLGAKPWRPFNAADWPAGKRLIYNYWAYDNESGTMMKQPPKMIQGQWWMRIKFDRLKEPRWVPVTSDHYGCHLMTEELTHEQHKDTWGFDWRKSERELWEKLNAAGIYDTRISAEMKQVSA